MELLLSILWGSLAVLGIAVVWALILALAMGVGTMLRQRQPAPLTQNDWLAVAPVPRPGTPAAARFNALPRDDAEACAMGLLAGDRPSNREPKPLPPGAVDGPPLIQKAPAEAGLLALGSATSGLYAEPASVRIGENVFYTNNRPEGSPPVRRPEQVAELSRDEKVRLLWAELEVVPVNSASWHQIRAELIGLGEEV